MGRMVERRAHPRFPTLSVIKTVEIKRGEGREDIPAIMCDLSAGGLAMITFLPMPLDGEIILDISIPGINLKDVRAKIVRIEEKKGTYLVALKFLKISNGIKKAINRMAADWKRCEENLAAGKKVDCSLCSYYDICTKEAKAKTRNVSHLGSA